MSNNDLYCSTCKSHHHPVECLMEKDAEITRLSSEVARLNRILGGMDVENPSAVDTMIDAMKEQGEIIKALKLRLAEAIDQLKTDKERFTNPKYECVWPDAAEEIEAALLKLDGKNG